MAEQHATPDDEGPLRELGLDEIVALNLAALIEEKRIPIAAVARHLGVSRAQVYDLLGRRSGRPQREFRWSEIVKLAGFLDVLVFDLVLPPEDVVLDGGMWLIRLTAADLWERPPDEVGELHVGALSRDEVALGLFGLGSGLLSRDKLDEVRRRVEETKRDRARAVEEEMESLGQAMKDLEELARNISEKLGE